MLCIFAILNCISVVGDGQAVGVWRDLHQLCHGTLDSQVLHERQGGFSTRDPSRQKLRPSPLQAPAAPLPPAAVVQPTKLPTPTYPQLPCSAPRWNSWDRECRHTCSLPVSSPRALPSPPLLCFVRFHTPRDQRCRMIVWRGHSWPLGNVREGWLR